LADLPWAKPQCREEVSAAIHSACTKNLCPAQRMSASARLTLCVATSSFVAAVGYWFGVRHNRSELGLRMGLLGALGWAIVQTAVLFMGFGPPRGRMSTRTVRLVLAVAVPVLFLGYLTFSAWSFVPFEQFSHGARVIHALGCGSVALFFGALVSGSVLLAWRGTDPLTPRLSGTLAGLTVLAEFSGLHGGTLNLAPQNGFGYQGLYDVRTTTDANGTFTLNSFTTS